MTMHKRRAFALHRLALLWALCAATLLGISACASRPNTPPPAQAPGQAATNAVGTPPAPQQAAETAKLETEFADALSTPLADLNLVRKSIPPVLQAAQQAPYATPANTSCAGIVAAVTALDAVLGADLDTPASAGKPSLIERGSDLASQAVVSAVQDSASGILPFRGWIRRLSGANKHARAVIAAISAGVVRRAYLKGLGQAQHCPSPASPAAPTAPSAVGKKPATATPIPSIHP